MNKKKDYKGIIKTIEKVALNTFKMEIISELENDEKISFNLSAKA